MAPQSRRWGLVRSLLFFIGFYLYLWLDVDLRLIYHGAGEIINFPSFFTGWAFFKEFLSRPGGLVEYAGAFLSQLFYIGWAGALIAPWQARDMATFVIQSALFSTESNNSVNIPSQSLS